MNNENNSDNKIKKQKLIFDFIGIIIFLVVCFYIIFTIAPNFKEYIKDPIKFKEYIQDKGFVGIIIFLIIQILQVIVSLIPGEMIEIAAGITYGWFFGLIMCLIGIAIASVIIFYVCRKLGKPYIDKLVGKGKLKHFDKLNNSSKRDTIIFIIFLIPGIPKDLITYAVSFFNINLFKFLIISLIARIPSVITSTISGHLILEGDYIHVVIIFIFMLVITAIGYYIFNKIMKKQN